ncbi:DUF5681 domain-containing protein [Erythrobacter sp. F6033]|uniref:DUF5681 domain-containing protein n=1 Tax=Erythrobacter sp. F6033 TaxID=2926401 RepID=UPI001FF46B21|nr:DUF5681 domain-containing protein [Erythrobacter sp. F6033]MCK0127515.1 DUF5681 domain-containing protein [Erythrobacter sp. F6033]
MSRGGDTRFKKGQSGNPAGRPKKRRPNVSAFDIVFDKVLTVNEGGKPRELTVEEGLQLQTYQAALGGSKMAIRQVLKMIEKRETALAKRNKPATRQISTVHEQSAHNATEALAILGMIETEPEPSLGSDAEPRWKVTTWAAQAGLSRPGKRQLEAKDISDIKFFTKGSERLRWPRGSDA